MIRKFFIFTFIFIIFTSTVSAFAYDFDDRNSNLIYSGKSVISDDSFYAGTASSLSTSNSVYFEFEGSSIYVYLAKYRNSGQYDIFIDGSRVYSGSIGTNIDYVGKQLAWSSEDLSSGRHTLTISCPSNYVSDAQNGNQTSGRVYVDYISTDSYFDDSFDSIILIILSVLLFILIVLKINSNVRKVMSL